MAIDVHAHWVPRGLMAAHAAGKDWYGWKVLSDPSGAQHLSLGEFVFPFEIAPATLSDPLGRIQRRIDNDGVDREALLLLALFWNYHLDLKSARNFCREANEELAEVQQAHPDHYIALGVLPAQHLGAAVDEMEYCIKELGIRSFVMATNVNGSNLDDPSVLPLLEAAAEARATVTCHPPIWGRAGEERMPRHYFANSFGAPLESSLAIMSLIYSGLLDRYPEFTMSFTQAGGWVTYGIGRFTLRYHQRDDARPMALPPEDYLTRLYYDCLIHDEKSLRLLIERAGADRVMIGTDQHAGGDIPGGAAAWVAESDLPDRTRELILEENALRFFGRSAG